MAIHVPVIFRGDADDLIDDIDRSLRGNVNRAFTNFGKAAADRFSATFSKETKRFSDRFRNGFSGSLVSALQGVAIRDPRVFAVLGASIAALFPAIGTLAAGAFVLGFGAGLAGLGLVFAAQNKRIKQIFKDLGSDIGDTMREISKPFEATLEVVARVARRTFNAFVPDLRAAFAKMAPVVSVFTRQLGKAFEELAPTIQPVTRAFIRILEDAGPRLVPFFKSLAKAINGMARAISKNPDVFNDIFGNLLNLIPKLFNFIAFLTRAEAKIESFFSALSNSSAGNGFRNLIDGITNTVKDFFSILNRGNEVGKTFEALKKFVEPLLPIFEKTATTVGTVLADGFRDIATILNEDLLPAFRRLLPVLQPIIKFLLQIFGTAVVGALKGLVAVIKGTLTVISGVINTFVGLVTGDWSLLWKGLKQIASGFLQLIIGAIRVFINVMLIGVFRKGAFTLLKGIWPMLWKGLLAAARGGFRAILGIFGAAFRGISKIFVGAVRGFVRFWAGLFRDLLAAARNGWKVLTSAFGGPLRAIVTLVTQSGQALIRAIAGALRGMLGAAKSGWQALQGAFFAGVNLAVTLVKTLPARMAAIIRSGIGAMAAAGAALIEGLASSVADKIGDVVDAVKDGLNKIKGLLPSSPIKWGPLKSWNGGKPGRALMQLIANGIRLGTPSALNAAVAAFAKISDLIAKQLKDKDIGKKAAQALQQQIRQLSAVLEQEAQRLASKLAERLDFISGLRDSLKGELSLTDILETSAGNVQSFISGVSAFAAGIKDFAQNLGALRKRGLHPALISEIAGLGSTEGNKVAKLLLKATGDQQSQLNQAFASIGAFSHAAADEVATGLFGTNAQIQAESRGRTQDILEGARAERAIIINQHFHGPTTSNGRLREIDWTLRFANKARRDRHGGVAK